MDNIFTDNLHYSRYKELASLSELHNEDWERMALFYIISGNKDLYMKRKAIYDFFENAIIPECLNSEKVDFCSSSKALILLGFNLFNGYYDFETNPLYILCRLDSKNLLIAFQAIFLRFQGRRLLPVTEDRENPGAT